MKLSELMDGLVAALAGSAISPKQVEAYEGQFEDVNNFIIMPPAIFVDIPSGGKSELRAARSGADIRLYVCTNNLHSDSQTASMLEAIETISKELPAAKTFGTFLIKYLSFEKIGNHPGFKVYQMNFRAN